MENSLDFSEKHRARLEELKGFLGIKTNSELARIIGVSPKTIKNYFESRDIGLTQLINLIKAYPEISLDWLLLGKGQPLRPKLNGDNVYINDYNVEEHRNHLVKNESYYKGLYEVERKKSKVLEKQIDILQNVLINIQNLQTKKDSQ